MSTDNTTIDTNGLQAKIAEKALDHATDAICALGIVASATTGTASVEVVGGLVSIALGKRVMGPQK